LQIEVSLKANKNNKYFDQKWAKMAKNGISNFLKDIAISNFWMIIIIETTTKNFNPIFSKG
jgi:hypothetical protein